MTAHFESVQNAAMYPDAFDVAAPEIAFERDLWPRKLGVFVRNAPVAQGAAADAALDEKALAAPVRELAVGQFGFVPQWVKSASDAKLRSTKMVNARSETVTTSNNFRDAWLAGQRCIVPMMAFFEDDWRSGKAVPTRITRVDGKPMGVAGIWERWAKDGAEIISFTLLTVNACTATNKTATKNACPSSWARAPMTRGSIQKPRKLANSCALTRLTC
jgi:putative SOS response-associated peptidase YedK